MMQHTAKQKTGKILLCAAMGLFLFWVLESGIARRAGFDLFLPVQGGSFLPGRVARLCAWIVVCFALGLTERGQQLGRWIDAARQKDWFCWALSAAVTGLFFLWATRVTVLSFMISDDVTTLKSIAAIPQDGLIRGTHTFSHVLFCGFLSLFYKIAPDGYWYTLYCVGIQLLTLWIIGGCILLKARRWPVWVGCVIHAVLCGGVFMYTFAGITFTLAAAMAGTGAVALVLCRHERKTAAGRIASDIGSALLMVLCYLQRDGSGQALLCFWGLAAGYQLVKTFLCRDDHRLRRVIAFALVILISLALVFGINAYRPVRTEPGYWWAERYRSRVVDYLIDDLTEEHFQAAGITPELATVLRAWYFMDERVTLDSFRTLVSAYNDSRPATQAAAQASSPLAGRIAWLFALMAELAAYMASEPHMLQLMGCALALLLVCLAVFWRAGRRYWPEALTAACVIGGSLILSLYLLDEGHFPLRAFQVVMFPAITTLVLMALSEPAVPEDGSPRRSATVLCILCWAAAAILCGAGVYFVPHATESVSRADLFADQWAMEAFARENPDITIINDAYYRIYDPWHTVGDYPNNLVWWGNCGDLSKPMEERLFADTFFRDDVLFLTDKPSSIIFLLRYLSVEYELVQADLLFRPSGGIYVLDISQITPPEEDYTGWFEHNGLTYYFVDGHPVTGTQTIDGEEYTFAAPGVDANPAISPGSAGVIYSTDSYSLITDGD